MSVRAKFKVDAIERIGHINGYENGADGKPDYSKPIKTEMQTIKMTPVYGNGDPNHENTRFWKASPSGSLSLGTINLDAAKQFELGGEYYLDFTRAS